jgi:hypothetical protein
METGGVAQGVHVTDHRTIDKMRRLTGIPAAVGAMMLAQGKIVGKGSLRPRVAWSPSLSSPNWPSARSRLKNSSRELID